MLSALITALQAADVAAQCVSVRGASVRWCVDSMTDQVRYVVAVDTRGSPPGSPVPAAERAPSNRWSPGAPCWAAAAAEPGEKLSRRDLRRNISCQMC